MKKSGRMLHGKNRENAEKNEENENADVKFRL